MSESAQKLFLNESEAATRYGLSRQWFARERWKKSGPPFIKINGIGRVLYPLDETDEWFKSFGSKQSISNGR